MLEEVKGYIFDYGATLDTAGCHWGKMLWHAYQRHHLPISEQAFRDAYVYAERYLGRNPVIKPHFTFHKTLEIKIRLEFEHLCSNGEWNVEEEDFQRVQHVLLDDLYSQVKVMTAHSLDVLHQLHERCSMVLVSNFYGNVNEVLHEFGFDGLFVDVIESANVGIRKPNPRIFSLGVDALGLRARDVAVVGDSFYKDIEPAAKLGCRTVWFKGEGWNNDVYDESFPDLVITDLAQLLLQ